MLSNCVVPENIHTPHGSVIPRPPTPLEIPIKIFGLRGPTPRKFQSLLWGGVWVFSGAAHFYIRPWDFLTVKLTWFPCTSWSLTFINREASDTCSWPVKECGTTGNFAFSPSPRVCDQSKSSGSFSVTFPLSDCPHLFTSNPTVNLWPSDSATHVTLLHLLLETHLNVECASSYWERLGMNFTAEHCFGWLFSTSSAAVQNKKKKEKVQNKMTRSSTFTCN